MNIVYGCMPYGPILVSRADYDVADTDGPGSMAGIADLDSDAQEGSASPAAPGTGEPEVGKDEPVVGTDEPVVGTDEPVADTGAQVGMDSQAAMVPIRDRDPG